MRMLNGISPIYGTMSYVIHKEGSNYYATSGVTGLRVQTNSNINTVLQGVINSCVNGDSIFFRPGEYGDASNYLSVTMPANLQGIRFIGSGRGNDTSTYGGTILNIAASGGINISNASDEKWYTQFEHLTFAGGSRAAAQGVHSDSQMADRKCVVSISNCHFVGFGGAGSHCVSITNHEWTIIKDSWFRGCPAGGQMVLLKCNDYYGGNAKIQNNYFNTDSGSNTGCDAIHIVTSNGKENDGYTIENNQFLNTAYPNYLLNLNAASGIIKQVCYAHNRGEHANHIRCGTAAGRVEYVFVHDNYINPDTTSSIALQIPLNGRCWMVHNNVFDVPTGRTGLSNLSDETLYPPVITGNSFFGAGTLYTGGGVALIRSNFGLADS